MKMEGIDFILVLLYTDHIQLDQHLDDDFQFNISDFSMLRGKRYLGTNFAMAQGIHAKS